MTKRFVLLIGLLLGVLLAEVLRRPTMRKLAILEAKEAEEKERFAEYDRQWQEEIAAMPFDKRMEWELWEAGMRLNNWMPDDVTLEDDDAETE